MLLTITYTGNQATDLGYLLNKSPSSVHSFEQVFGKAYVYPEKSPERCTAALRLEIDPIGLVRNRRGPSGEARLHVGVREYELRETLTNLERRLNPIDFLRIHRSTIVNVYRIKEIQRWFRGHHLILLENGKELRMSRYQSEIAKRLGLA